MSLGIQLGISLGQPAGGGASLPLLPNLLLKSRQFNAAEWAVQNATVSTNAATSSDGTTSMEGLIPGAGAVAARVLQNATVSIGATYTASFEIKDGPGFDWFDLTIVCGSVWRGFFNASTGAKGSSIGSPVAYDVIARPNGVTRVYLTFVAGDTNCSVYGAPRPGDGVVDTVNGDGSTVAVFLDNAQLVAGTSPGAINETP